MSFCVSAQKLVLTGYVLDKLTGEVLSGANIYIPKTSIGTTTNSYGYYYLKLDKTEPINLQISFIGYETKQAKIDFNEISDSIITRNFELKQGVFLNDVSVVADKTVNNEIGVNRLSIKTIQQIPSLTGESDVLKAFQLMPGVQRGDEGTSGIFVRGGSPDQNLILLDDVPLYYINHVGGWFSIFDENAISDVKLIKGGFPARYGGRLSSVLDIKMREGNMYEYKVIVSLGLLTSKISLEGPVKKEKSSFFLTARRCNLDLLSRSLLFLLNDPVKTGYTFYDVNFKINHKFSENDRVFLSFYYGDDIMYYKTGEQETSQNAALSGKYNYNWDNRWGNILTTIRFNHVFSPRLFSNFSIAYLRYRYKYENSLSRSVVNPAFKFKSQENYNSGINDLTSKFNLDFYLNNQYHIKLGASGVFHTFYPGGFNFYEKRDTIITENSLIQSKLTAFEPAFYIENKYNFKNKLFINAGLRYSSYFTVNKSYSSFEPRFSIDFKFNDALNLNTSFTQMKQYVHLLSNSNIGMAYDMWLPSTKIVQPEKAKQLALGIHYSFSQKQYSVTFESYYKKMSRLIDFKEGASFIEGDTNWENRLETNGKGNAYGFEFLAERKSGKLTGWISYTYAKNDRLFSNLNLGKEFPYRYDRRHNLSIVLAYILSKRIKFGLNWVFSSGEAMTLGVSKYPVPVEVFKRNDGFYYKTETAYNYASKNNYRLPAYHRLDISMTLSKNKTKGRVEWNFGIYNVYNQKNPYFLYYDISEDNTIQLYKLSLFPIIPSISYRYYLKK